MYSNLYSIVFLIPRVSDKFITIFALKMSNSVTQNVGPNELRWWEQNILLST